jgi:hypothetical protein
METEKMKAVLSAVGGWDADNKMTSNTKPEGGSLGGSWTGAFAATGKRRARQIRNFTLYPFCSEKNVRLNIFLELFQLIKFTPQRLLCLSLST